MSQINNQNYKEYFTTFGKEQQTCYEDNGIVVVKNLIDKDILENCRKRFIDICEKRVKSNAMLVKEATLEESNKHGEVVINKIQYIIDDEVFGKYFKNDKLLDAISHITGPSIVNILSFLINKPPQSGRHPPHQDLYYFPYESIVTTLTAIDDMDAENGCLYYIPGSHKHGQLLSHAKPSYKVLNGLVGVDEEYLSPECKRVNIPLKAGDTLFMHPYTIHGSGSNITNRFRKLIIGVYRSSTTGFTDTSTAGAKIVSDVSNRNNISKGLSTLSYEDYYKNISKPVRRPKSHI